MIPTQDNVGNPLVDIGAAAHHYLFYGPVKVEGSYVERDKTGNWRDMAPEPHDMLVTYAEETPQMDSEMKQLAVHVAEVANQWGIFVIKENGKGINTWTIANPSYRPGEPADPTTLAPQQYPVDDLLA